MQNVCKSNKVLVNRYITHITNYEKYRSCPMSTFLVDMKGKDLILSDNKR